MGKREGKEGGKGNLGKKKSRESCEFSKVGAYDRVQYKQCWRKLEWGLQLQQLALNFPLRQRIRPFTTNKAVQGPLYTVIGPFYPRVVPRSAGSGVLCPGSEYTLVRSSGTNGNGGSDHILLKKFTMQNREMTFT